MAEQPHVWTDRRRNETYRRVSGGTFLICIGGVLLLNTLDWLGWGVWFELLRLWPVLLISLGLRLLFVNTPLHFLSLAGPALVLLTTVAVVAGYDEREQSWTNGFEEEGTLSVECAPAPRGGSNDLDLGFATGSLRLVSISSPGEETREDRPAGWGGRLRYTGKTPSRSCPGGGALRVGGEGITDSIRFIVPFRDDRRRWDLSLSSGLPVDVRADLVAADAHLDLRAFEVDDLDLEVRGSDLVVLLPAPGKDVKIDIEGALSRVRLELPPGTCYEVTRRKRLNILNTDDVANRPRRARHVKSDSCRGLDPDQHRYRFSFGLPLSVVSVETGG